MITRGENKGRTVTYHNVVRRLVDLGTWNASTNRWNVPLRDLAGDGVDTAAVLVQTGTAGEAEHDARRARWRRSGRSAGATPHSASIPCALNTGSAVGPVRKRIKSLATSGAAEFAETAPLHRT